ncbi:proto-oncogene c-Rel [Anopheles sinensis]|uniref:Proto-oncogene c-Rel n=1 Tax=Anopheles sinensis TaxID=74873 RepID=A0A084WDC7_ANOSI|nr:proto-oncogene c-Rel [Anopheles sinensis]
MVKKRKHHHLNNKSTTRFEIDDLDGFSENRGGNKLSSKFADMENVFLKLSLVKRYDTEVENCFLVFGGLDYRDLLPNLDFSGSRSREQQTIAIFLWQFKGKRCLIDGAVHTPANLGLFTLQSAPHARREHVHGAFLEADGYICALRTLSNASSASATPTPVPYTVSVVHRVNFSSISPDHGQPSDIHPQTDNSD